MSRASRFTSTVAVLLSSAALALAAAACSDSDDNKGGGPGGDGPGAGGAGGSGGGPGGGGNYTLENVCDHVAATQCGHARACCESSDVGYDQAGCEAGMRRDCEAGVAKVKEGKMTFNPAAVDGCLTALGGIYQKCELTYEELFGMEGVGAACQYVFAGTVEQGGDCEDDEECKPFSDTSKFAVCEAGKCVAMSFSAGEGDACDSTTFCGPGLYCAPEEGDGSGPGAGKCQKQKKAGDSCSSSIFMSECEEGTRCDESSNTCVAAKPIGADCEWSLECASLNCEEDKCAEAGKIPIVDGEICTGEADESGF